MFFGRQLHDLHGKFVTFQVKRNAPLQVVRSAARFRPPIIPAAWRACRAFRWNGLSWGTMKKKSKENSEDAELRSLIKKLASLSPEVRDAMRTLVFATSKAHVTPQT